MRTKQPVKRQTDRQTDGRTESQSESRRVENGQGQGAEMGSSIKLGGGKKKKREGWMFGRMFRVPSPHVPVVNTA